MAEKVRLLICGVCKSIEELPWYEGPQEYDDTGNYRLSQHKYGDGRLHPFTVGDVEKAQWAIQSVRDQLVVRIAEQIAAGGHDAGLGQQFYDVRSTFMDDAMKCWKQHGRPGSPHKVGCEDYKSDRKRLLPDTAADRRAASTRSLPLSPRNRPGTFLCQFCPYHRAVEDRVRNSRGEYDKQSWEGNE